MAEIRPTFLLFLWGICVLFSASEYGLGVVDALKNDPYCFSLTWLGPKWNNESQGNGTCSLMENTPEVCMDPLVITYDSTPPNMTYLWKMYDKTEIGCRLTENEACVKFTFYYNGKVENITYMCARIIIDNEATMTSGCETASFGGYDREVCACRTLGDFPCNRGESVAVKFSLLMFATMFVFRGLWLPNWT